MKLTVLDYVQNILSSLSADEVNSIGDTTESLQVKEILKTCYFNIVSRSHLPEHKQFIQFLGSNDTTKPVLMYLPDGTTGIEWVKYFNNNIKGSTTDSDSAFEHDLNLDIPDNDASTDVPAPGYQDVTLIPVHDFINITSGFDPSDSNVASYTFTDSSNSFPGSFTLYYKTDRQPMYCTVVSDYYVLFDSYDNTVDSTLQTNKCLAYGQVIPAWKDEDTFVPLLDEAQVPLLLNEAKSLAFLELKQTLHQKAEQESKRQWSSLQRDKSRADKASDFDRLPNFGRWGRSSFAGLSFFKSIGWDRR